MEEQKQNWNTRSIIGAVLIVIVALALFFFTDLFKKEASRELPAQKEEADFVTKPTQVIENFEEGMNVSLYEIKAANGAFEPNEIVVKLGAPVSFVLRAVDADYDLKFSYAEELPLLVARKGEISDSLVFAPEKVGEFPFSCPSCPRTLGKKVEGVLVVKMAE